MAFIEKELLISRVQYLEQVHSRPGAQPVDKSITDKVKEMIQSGELFSFMQVEAVFNYLVEQQSTDKSQLEQHAKEILAFIN